MRGGRGRSSRGSAIGCGRRARRGSARGCSWRRGQPGRSRTSSRLPGGRGSSGRSRRLRQCFWIDDRADRAPRRRAPRCSKLSYWSKLAQAGARRTTSPASASASAAATAASRVPATTCGVSPRVAAKSCGGLADQVGLGDAREERARAPRCRPPSGGRRRSSGCARRRGAPSRRRRRWSPSKSLTMRTPRQVATSWLRCGEAGVAGERGLDLARARGRGCGRRRRRRRRSGGCGRRGASAWAAGRSRRPGGRGATRRGSPCGR